jgi:hypothetical protein
MTQTTTFIDNVQDAIANLPRANLEALQKASRILAHAWCDYHQADDYNKKATAYTLFRLCSGLDNKAQALQKQSDKLKGNLSESIINNTGTEIDAGRLTEQALRKATVDNYIADVCAFRDFLVDEIENATGERWTPYVPTIKHAELSGTVSSDIAHQLLEAVS